MTTPATPPLLYEVGGIRFLLSSGPAPLPPPAPYHDFLQTMVRNDLASDLSVHVAVAPRLTIPDSRAFSAGGSWSFAREGSDRIVILDPPALGGAAWCTARFPPGVDRLAFTLASSAPYHLSYPVDQILLMFRLALAGGFIVHGAGFGYAGGGYAFPGVSGAGKTTFASLLRDRTWGPLSDDRVIIRDLSGTAHLFGTPWPGEGMVAVNRHYPLRGIFFLAQGPRNLLRELEPRETARRLLAVSSIPWFDDEFLPLSLDSCGHISESIPSWEFTFRPDEEAARFLEEFLART